MAESVQELLDLYNRGWAPRASDGLRDNFDNLLGRVHYFSDLLQRIYDVLSHGSVGEPEQLRRLVYTIERLDDLHAKAKRNFDLERPYDFIDLQNFTKYIDSELQDIRYILQSGDWITDGIHQRFFELSDSFDDFVKSVYKEEIGNNDKRIALQNAAEQDIKFNPSTNVKNKGDNTMDKTLEAFDGIYEYIKRFEQAVQDGEGYADAYSNIINFIDDLLEHKEISERMAQKYFEIMNELHDYPSEMVKELKTLTNDYTDKAKDADKKLNVALDWSGNAAEYVDKQNDSKLTLDLLNNLISQYDKEYNEVGELESVDALCRVGNEIRTALDENKLSRKTADDLMKPLQEIKDNMFDEKLHEDKIKEFMDVLADAMSRQDEKSPIEKPKGKDGQKIDGAEMNAPEYAGGNGILGNAIHDTAILGRNIGRTVQNVVRGIKEADKKIEEKAKAKAAEHEEMQMDDLMAELGYKKEKPQQQKDDKEKILNEIFGRQRKTQAKDVVQKKQPLSLSELEDMGRARIEAFKEKYDLSDVGRRKYNEAQWKEILDQELDFSDIEDTFRDDFVKGMRDFYWKDPEIRDGVRVNNIPKPSIKAQIDAEYKSRHEESNPRNIGRTTPNILHSMKETDRKIDDKGLVAAREYDKKLQREMGSKDIVQSAADDKRKLESELQQQDKTADKQGQKKESPEQQKAQDTDSKFGVLSDKVKYSQQEQALDNLRDLLNNYSEIYHSVPESRLDAWDKFINAYNRYIHQYPESELRNAEFNRAAFNVTNRDESIKFMKQAIGHAQFSLANSDGVAKDKHVVAGVENREQQHTPQTNEKAIAELQRIGKMFDRQHSDESLKKMMLSLKESVKQGVIPREYFDTYKGIVDDYKQNRNADNSLLRLDNEINLQIAEMRNDGKNAKEYPQQKKNKEREMGAADIVQSAADDKRKLKEDVKTQDTKADKQGVKKHTMKSLHDTINNYKKGIAQGSVDDVRKEFVNISHEIESAVQQSVISEKLANDLIKHMRDVAGLKGDKDFIPQSPEYMGVGKRKGKDDNAQIRAQEDKELAPDRTDISSKFKDGIVNVLNKQRTEQRAANETKEKDSLEQRRIMALRKFFKKEQDQ